MERTWEPTLWVCQVGEVCGGGDGDGVEGVLGHLGLGPPGALRGHQHHGGVAGRAVVRLHHARLHMSLGDKEQAVC